MSGVCPSRLAFVYKTTCSGVLLLYICFPKVLYNVWGSDTVCLCAYQMYRLEESFGDKASQFGIMMQSTIWQNDAVYSLA